MDSNYNDRLSESEADQDDNSDNRKNRRWKELKKNLQAIHARKYRWIMGRFNVSSDRFEIIRTNKRYKELKEKIIPPSAMRRRRSSASSQKSNEESLLSEGMIPVRHNDPMVEFFSVPTLYCIAEHFGPLEMTMMGTVSSFWFLLTQSEMLWMMLCFRLKIFHYGDWFSIKYQQAAFNEQQVDGRAWRNACFIGLAFERFQQSLPDNLNCFGIFDFEHAPSKTFSARKEHGQELIESPAVTKARDRPIVLFLWDPENFPVPRRRPLLELFLKVNTLHEHIPWITHVLHFRKKSEIQLPSILQKLICGYGRSEDVMREEASWALPSVLQKKLVTYEESEKADISHHDKPKTDEEPVITQRTSITVKSFRKMFKK